MTREKNVDGVVIGSFNGQPIRIRRSVLMAYFCGQVLTRVYKDAMRDVDREGDVFTEDEWNNVQFVACENATTLAIKLADWAFGEMRTLNECDPEEDAQEAADDEEYAKRKASRETP